MDAWVQLTSAEVLEAIPTDMAALYAQWVDVDPARAVRIVALTEETVAVCRAAVAARYPGLLDPVHFISPDVADFLPDRLLEHAQSHAGWVVPGLRHNCDDRLFERIRQTGFRGPPWTLLRRISL